MKDPYPVENIDKLGDLMFQTSDNSQLLRRVLWINADLTIVWSLKHKNTQPSYIFNGENPQNSEPQNGPRRGLDFIALPACKEEMLLAPVVDMTGVTSELGAHEHEFHQKTYRESSSLSSNIKAFAHLY